VTGPDALFLIFAAGVVSFLSPCTLPLLPGYLSYISGVGADEIQSGNRSGTLLSAAGLYVLGFTLVFVTLGTTASYIGSLVAPYHETLTRAAGIFIIVMGLVMLGVFRFPLLMVEKRFHLRNPGSAFGRDVGIWSALPLGMAFAFGWSPCIGPVLAPVLAYATTVGTAQKGAFLLLVYALGLGVPFLLMALFAGRALSSLGWFKRHFTVINRVGGAILLVMGVFLLMNRWTALLAPAMRWYAQFNLPT
jgi:cytochrome c-type biogenesis protein